MNKVYEEKSKLGVKRKQAGICFLSFRILIILVSIMSVIDIATVRAAPGGFGQFFVPADEDNLAYVLRNLQNQTTAGQTMHSIIAITAWAGDTEVYYDHWEDGYEFDPNNPVDYDEKFTLNNRGDAQQLESSSIALSRTVDASQECVAGVPGAGERNCPYDGRDIIYVAGGSVTVSRGGWLQGTDTYQAVAWEVYPVRPQLIKYILPFGENLNGSGLNDFERVYAFIQATNDNTIVEIDFNGDGTKDSFDHDRNGSLDGSQMTLSKGQVYLLDQLSDGSGNPFGTLDSGTTIYGSDTIQVQYLIGDQGSTYEVRGLSAFPRGFWDNEYYAPVDEAGDPDRTTDIFLYNPHTSAITINWESSSSSGSFSIPSKSTVSFIAQPGASVPEGGAVYMRGSDVFWGISTIDTEDQISDWGYSLVPASLLSKEHYMGWAPAYDFGQLTAPQAADEKSGLFITAAQDNIRLFIDEDNDGTPDQTFSLDRLESIYVTSSDSPSSLNDDDLSRARVYATGPYSIAYGQNPDNSFSGDNPALDLGYTVLPSADQWFDLVLDVSKSANPAVVAANTSGEQTTFTIEVNTFLYKVEDVTVTDVLPSGWEYVAGNTTVTLPDGSSVTGSTADDGNSTGDTTLTWSGSDVFSTYEDLDENQTITISFVARTDVTTHNAGDLSVNDVQAQATRTVETVTQTFTATDFCFLTYGNEDLDITKTSNVSGSAYPGDTITYTVVVENGGSTDLTGISLYDAMPTGTTYVDDSSQLTALITPYVRDEFTNVAYDNQDGNIEWENDWDETGDDDNPSSGDIQINGNQIRIDNDDASPPSIEREVDLSSYSVAYYSFNFTTSGNEEGDDDIIVEVSSNGGTSWTTLETISGPQNGSRVYNISSYAASNTRVRFRVGSGDYAGSGEFFYVDNITIRAATSSGTYRDNFSSQVYNRSDGTISWTSESWDETNDNDSAVNGDIYINTTANELWIGSASGGDLESIERQADLSAYQAAYLSFDYDTPAAVDTGDIIAVEVSGNGGTSWTTLESFDGEVSGSASYDISDYAAANTRIRFRITANYGGAGEYFEVDNLTITVLNKTSTTVSSGEPPGFIQAGDNVSLAAGQSLTLTFQVTVDDPLDTGITELTNTASVTTAEIFIPISDSVTDPVTNPSSQSAKVGDTVWLDIDGDGVLETGEPGIANVRVWLKDEYGATKDTVWTDSKGKFLFSGVEPGNDYYVEVDATTLPAGLSQSYPSSSHNNKTNQFDLSAGQTYLNADLGYEPDEAAIGDLVWSDVDGDGIRDIGEPGLSGVTLYLYEDVDDDGICEPGGDDGSAIDTTTTSADGTYLFTDIAADGTKNFFVYIDESQAALTGYTRTYPGGSNQLVTDLAAGAVILNVDYGYQGPNYTVSDKVWFDADSGGDFDTGETGIKDVTVDLLNSSSFVIASTTTDSSGNFSFTGLPNGKYTIKITDTDGKLNDYYGTTSYAESGQRVITISGSNVSNNSFGYNLEGSIGDTVFNDVNNNGVQDTGEAGFSNVTVKLYSDADGDGVIETGDTVVATVITDADGNYLFTGLANDDYIVSIETGPSGYNYNGSGSTADSDSGTTGAQQSSTIASGGNDLSRDFPYIAPTQRTISGTIWENDDEDAVIDTGESKFENVTVEIYLDDGDDTFETEGSDVLINTVSTDSSGNYSFTGLSTGKYWVRVTDNNNILSGYNTNYEKTEVTTSPFNDRELVDVTSADQTDINFGYKKPEVTFVVVSSIKAYESDGRVIVEWETASEHGTLGFYLKRRDDKTGKYKRLNKKMLPGLLHSPEGGTYRYVDKDAIPGGTYTYKLVEIEASGKKRRYGPYAVTVGFTGIMADPSEQIAGEFSKKARKKSLKKLKRLLKAKKTKEQNRLIKKRQKGMMAKIAVKHAGVYYLDAVQIAEVLDIKLENAQNRIKKNRLNLYNQGKQVAWMPDASNTGLYFYAEATDTNFTDENIYWLGKDDGLNMNVNSGKNPDADFLKGFYTASVHAEEDHYAMPSYYHDPNADYWLWDYVFAPYAGMDRKTFVIRATAPADVSYGSRLKVELKGVTDTDAAFDHKVEIYFNGILIGGDTWDGYDMVVLDLDVDPSLLNDGDNMIDVAGLINPGVPYSLFYVNNFTLSYPRYYAAENNRLIFEAEDNEIITITGFTAPDIMVFDITNARKPKSISNLNIEEIDGVYQVSFKPKATDHRYIAVAWDAVLLVDNIVADTRSTLMDRKNHAEYLIIAPEALKTGAQAFADYRSEFQTMVVNLEDIYDEFNDGIADPGAIKNFLAHAHKKWKTPPRYVLLVGEGTYDYKDILGNGDNLLPTMLMDTPEGLFPSDILYGDVAGDDGIPEFAIGRIPAVSDDEVQTVIAKIASFEAGVRSGYGWTQKVLMTADNQDEAGNFPADSDELAALLPQNYQVSKAYLSNLTPADARTLLMNEINGGVFLINYLGHGGFTRMASEGLLLDTDIPFMQNSHAPSVMTAVTCLVGHYAMPGVDSIAELMLLHNNGGAAAVWAPSGMSIHYMGKELDQAFFKAVFREEKMRMGDAILSAINAYQRNDENAYIPDMFILLGDPAMQIR